MIIFLYHSCHLITDANTSKDQRENLQIINTDIFSNLSINLYLSQIYLSKVCFNLRNLYIRSQGGFTIIFYTLEVLWK
jgi:hypothetical protein